MKPARDISDEDLACSLTDEAAFAELYARYASRVTGYATRMLGRPEEGEDICTEVFVRVLRSRWKPTGTFRGWLFTIAHRICVDRLRRRERTRTVFGLLHAVTPQAASPQLAIEVAERAHRVDAALATLPEEHRAILLLYYTEELRSREIASILHCEDHQVRSRLSYARRLLRKQLGDEELP